MIQNPLISVIIPVYNCEKYISEAINSVLKQDYLPLEIIVVDDGSTDKTTENIKEFGSQITYIYQENGGTAKARNNGIKNAKGDYFAFLDADDIWVENKLKMQMEVFVTNPETDLVFGEIQQFYSPDLDESIKKQIYCHPQPLIGCSPTVMLIKREAFFTIGEFSTNLKIAEFGDWYARVKESDLNVSIPPIVMAKRRLHQGNKGRQNKQEATVDYVRMIKASLDRRRAKNKNQS